MHRDFAQSEIRRRSQDIAGYNSKTGVRPVNLTTGDFIMKARQKRGRKLQLTWTGPFRVRNDGPNTSLKSKTWQERSAASLTEDASRSFAIAI